MRRAYKQNWLEEGNQWFGVNFGADYCAEHEWGIEDLSKYRLGCTEDTSIMGIERRRCKPDPNCVLLKEEGDTLSLIIDSDFSIKDFEKRKLDDEHYSEWKFREYDDNKEMVTCWSGNNCMVRVKGEKNFKRLRRLHEQLMAGNVAVWLGGSGVFANAGLCLAIISDIPEEFKTVMKKADENRAALKKAAESTGIVKEIDEINKVWRHNREVETGRHCFDTPPLGYFALSPRWKYAGEKSQYNVMFWLNPRDQQNLNCGWFSVEQLQAWIKGEGPVLKNKKKVKA